MNETVKVMIADDHVLMREGIKQLLEFDGTVIFVSHSKEFVKNVATRVINLEYIAI